MAQSGTLAMYRHNTKTFPCQTLLPVLLFAILFVSGFALTFMFPAIRALYVRTQLGDAVETEAVVTETWSLIQASPILIGVTYHFDVPLSDGGQERFTNDEQIAFLIDDVLPEPGGTVTILYNPDNPRYSMTKQHVEQHLASDWITLICAGGLLVIGGVLPIFWLLNTRYGIVRMGKERNVGLEGS